MHVKTNDITKFIYNEIYTELLYRLEIIIGNNPISSENIIVVVVNLMSHICKYTELPNKKKKKYILSFIVSEINKSSMDIEDKNDLLDIVKIIIPNTIDVLIDVANKKYILKKKRGCFRTCV